MDSFTILFTSFIFLLTLIFILWRPNGINEAYPALIGGTLMLLCGSIKFSDLIIISENVSGAAITIIATMVMAIALESFGLFHWVSIKLIKFSNGSGIKLFWLINLLCFLMTLFFNNDGSILITTPILILLFKRIGLGKHEQVPFLISGVLIATASSAPIGVSNVVNLISLKMIGMNLYVQTKLMFIPSTLGLCFLALILYLLLYKRIPKKIPGFIPEHYEMIERYHPLQNTPSKEEIKKQQKMMIQVLLFIFLMRIGLYVASILEIPIWIIASIGSCIILWWRYHKIKIGPFDVLKKAPWHIFIFPFSMYMMIYGLKNIGFIHYLASILEPFLSNSLIHSTLTMGILISLLSNLFNNHPALMVGTLTLTSMNLDSYHLNVAYLSSIIGSDIGSLILPIGTLATLIWMHILKQNGIIVHWKEYIYITFLALPPTIFLTLLSLFLWLKIIY